MTNLNMAVRLDALKSIHGYSVPGCHHHGIRPGRRCLTPQMDFIPELVIGGFLAPCLLHFCDVLSQESGDARGLAAGIGGLAVGTGDVVGERSMNLRPTVTGKQDVMSRSGGGGSCGMKVVLI